VVHIGNLMFTSFQIGCAQATSLSALIVFRFLAGIGGSAILSVGGGIISDCFREENIGRASAAFGVGPLLGPVVGPVAYYFIGMNETDFTVAVLLQSL